MKLSQFLYLNIYFIFSKVCVSYNKKQWQQNNNLTFFKKIWHFLVIFILLVFHIFIATLQRNSLKYLTAKQTNTKYVGNNTIIIFAWFKNFFCIWHKVKNSFEFSKK